MECAIQSCPELLQKGKALILHSNIQLLYLDWHIPPEQQQQSLALLADEKQWFSVICVSSDNVMNRFPVHVSWGSILWYDGGDSNPEDQEWYDIMVCWGGGWEGEDA